MKRYFLIILLLISIFSFQLYTYFISEYGAGVEKIVLKFDHPIIIETYYPESWGPWEDSLELNIQLIKPSPAVNLLFYVRVYNLTENGARKIAEIDTFDNTVSINIRMWRKLLWVDKKEEKIVKKVNVNGMTINQTVGNRTIYIPVFWKQGIFVYAIAYNNATKKIYTASWSASLDPYYNKTTYIALSIKELGSTYVHGDKVPKPGQTKTEYKTGPNVCAINIPQYSSYLYNIPKGMPVYCDVKKKNWYMVEGDAPTDPDSLWEEEGWEKSGTTTVYIDSPKSSDWTPGSVSVTWYVYQLKTVYSTSAEVSPVYHVILLAYAVDTGDDRISSKTGFPSGSSTLIDTIARGDTGSSEYDFATVYYLKVGPFTLSFGAIIGDNTQVSISGSISFDVKVDRGYFKVRVPNWSQVPSEYNNLKVYKVEGKKSQIKAVFTG